MPQIENIERFKKKVNELGDEPEILAQRGEEIEDIPPPEAGLPSDISELLDDDDSAESPEQDEDLFADFDVDQNEDAQPPLDELPDLESEFWQNEEDEQTQGVETGGPGPGEIDELSDQEHKGESEGGTEEDFGLPDEFFGETGEEPAEDEPAGQEETPGADAGEEDFALPDELFGEEAGAEAGTAETEAPGAEEGEEEDFVLPDELFGEEAGAEAGTAETEAPGAEAGEEDFALPDELFGEESGAEAGTAETEEPGAEAGEEDFALPDELFGEEAGAEAGTAETEAPAEAENAADEFDLPDDLFGSEQDEEPAPESEGQEEPVPGDLFDESPEAALDTAEPQTEEDSDDFTFSDDDLTGLGELTGEEDEAEGEQKADTSEELDDFDLSAEFGESDNLGDSPETAGADQSEEEAAGEPGEDTDLDDLSDDDFSVDEFSLGDFGDEFGISSDESQAPQESEAAYVDIPESVAAAGTDAAIEKELELTDDQFESIQQTLQDYPRNLKIAVEELIGEQDLGGERLDKLINMLLDDESAYVTARYVSKILNRKIEIPKGYEKERGESFERKRKSLSYVFVYVIWPKLSLFLIVSGIMTIVLGLGYQFIFKPVYATILYNDGYDDLEENRFTRANELFARAGKVWSFKGRYYQYARGFIEKRQYDYAVEKYHELLNIQSLDDLDRMMLDERGVKEYSRFLLDIFDEPVSAGRLLQRHLQDAPRDRELLLLAGESFFKQSPGNPDALDESLKYHETYLQRYGGDADIHDRMIDYHIQQGETEPLRAYRQSINDNPGLYHPQTAAKVAGYFLDINEITGIQSILRNAHDRNSNIPEVHYQWGRFFSKSGEAPKQKNAMLKTAFMLNQRDMLDDKEAHMLIDSYRQLGELEYHDLEPVKSRQNLIRARDYHGWAQKWYGLSQKPQYGKIYADLGDLHYFLGSEYENALDLYKKAESERYWTPAMGYRKGFARYKFNDTYEALYELERVARWQPDNMNLLYAHGTVAMERNDYDLAVNGYEDLIEHIEIEESGFRVFRPEERPDQRALLNFKIMTLNNLGVALYKRSFQRSEDPRTGEALAYLSQALEEYIYLQRDPETLARPEARGTIIQNNINEILYDLENYEPVVYKDLPKSLGTRRLFFTAFGGAAPENEGRMPGME